MIFNPLDGLIIIGLGTGAFWGFNRGSLREFIELACFYVATLVTTLLFQKPAKWLALHVNLPLPFAEILIFALLLAALFSAFLYIALDFIKPPKERFLTIPDRVGGMILGLLFALLLTSILLLSLDYALKLNWLRWDSYRRAISDTRFNSFLAPIVEDFGKTALMVLKPFFRKGLPSFWGAVF